MSLHRTAADKLQKASDRLNEIEEEMREDASGLQDGQLLEVANIVREVIRLFGDPHQTSHETTGDDWGCDYCRNDGELTDANTCPECDAEFLQED